MSERVEKELEKWNKEYEIPLEDEFNVQTLLELQEEYRNTPKESNTTKTREVILHMINEEKSHLRNLSKRRNYKDYIIEIAVNKKTDIPVYANKFVDILQGNIKMHFPNGNILLKDGRQIIFSYKDNDVRGRRINEYLNLTGDEKYDEVLKLRIKNEEIIKMHKNKVQITYNDGTAYTTKMTVEEYIKFKNYNENKDNVEDMKMIFD